MMNKLILHLRAWNIWRKANGNSKFYKFLVLIGFTKSPTMINAYFDLGVREGLKSDSTDEITFNPWDEELKKEQEFWESMGENEGYISIECPNCGRHRVEHWSCGKDICEKCHWCIQDNRYFNNEYFNL